VDSAPQERTAVLVIRVWTERSSGLRARITHTLDLGSGNEAVTTALSPPEIITTVESWLDDFTNQRGARQPSK
jgi:hypothetical protein